MGTKGLVHLATIEDPFGDFCYIVPTTSRRTWISRAIEENMPASCRWSDDLSSWLVDENAYDLLAKVIEDEAGHDEPWCPVCVGWLDDVNQPICNTVDTMQEVLEEVGCLLMHDSEDTMAENTFRIPDALRKLFADEGSEISKFLKGEGSKFLKGRAREILRKQVSAVGVNVSDTAFDEFFEAVFASMSGKVADRATKMSMADAASILEVQWPCGKEDVIKAFRVKARETHPDMGGSNEAFLKVGAAREVLMGACP